MPRPILTRATQDTKQKRSQAWHKLPFKAKRLCEKVEKEGYWAANNESEAHWLEVLVEIGALKRSFGWDGDAVYRPQNTGACCPDENRTMAGSCRNCGDPCF